MKEEGRTAALPADPGGAEKSPAEECRTTPSGRAIRLRRKVCYTATLIVLLLFVAEFALRCFATERPWVKNHNWISGSGHTVAGPKFWPSTTYTISTDEYTVHFRTNARGYRAAEESIASPSAYRIAFVGDSYTDALQVEYDDTFCAGVQSYLRRAFASKDLRTENYGVSGTGLFAYWHRILHDVLDSEPPNALVLCINPGNDFTDFCPDDGFAADGTPLRDYFTAATLRNHVNTWAVQHSALALYVYRKYKIYRASKPLQSTEGNGRTEPWWTRAEMAESVLGTRKVRNALSLVRAIVAECRQRDVQCAILILGNTSYATDGSQSPITEIFRKAGIQCPILDVCHHMDSSAKQYAFPMDGHLNREGHRFVTSHAAPFLAGKLDFSPLCPQPPFP